MITGRAKDLIKSGGEWINPAEIEAVVASLPEVSLAAVIGRRSQVVEARLLVPEVSLAAGGYPIGRSDKIDKWGERPILRPNARKSRSVSEAARPVDAPPRPNSAREDGADPRRAETCSPSTGSGV
jgi:acyl-CoA synthetase (AMP-forming)/AMP-acid ligase II